MRKENLCKREQISQDGNIQEEEKNSVHNRLFCILFFSHCAHAYLLPLLNDDVLYVPSPQPSKRTVTPP